MRCAMASAGDAASSVAQTLFSDCPAGGSSSRPLLRSDRYAGAMLIRAQARHTFFGDCALQRECAGYGTIIRVL